MSFVCDCGAKLGQASPSRFDFWLVNQALADWATVSVTPVAKHRAPSDATVEVNVASVLLSLGVATSSVQLCTKCRRIWIYATGSFRAYQPDGPGLEPLVVTPTELEEYRQGQTSTYLRRLRDPIDPAGEEPRWHGATVRLASRLPSPEAAALIIEARTKVCYQRFYEAPFAATHSLEGYLIPIDISASIGELEAVMPPGRGAPWPIRWGPELFDRLDQALASVDAVVGKQSVGATFDRDRLYHLEERWLPIKLGTTVGVLAW